MKRFGLIFLVISLPVQVMAASFVSVHDSTGIDYPSGVTVWDDGVTVRVGYGSGQSAFFRNGAALPSLGMNPRASTPDGSIIVGNIDRQACTWNGTSIQTLGILPGYEGSWAQAISTDGSVIVGTCANWSRNWQLAFMWKDGVMQSLGALAFNSSYATDVSADGKVILGYGNYSKHARWEDGAWSTIPVPEGTVNGEAAAMSGNGRVFVGRTCLPDPDPVTGYYSSLAYKYVSGVAETLETMGGLNQMGAMAANFDASIIVGYGNTFDFSSQQALIWDAQGDIHYLKDFLQTDCGLDLAGWTLTYATGISDDGTMIWGTGTNPLGMEDCWIATIPEPATVLLFVGVCLMARRRVAA